MAHEDRKVKGGHENTYWEKIADTRWGAYTSDVARRTILRAHGLSRRTTKALEIGCEGGRWSTLLTALGWNMICTDVDERVLKICKERIPAADCILVRPNDNSIPCPSNSVDLLLCMEVAPVIQSSWFIDESFRVLNNDGLVVGVCWNVLSLRGLYCRMRDALMGRMSYYNVSYYSWKIKLSDRGFRFLSEEGYCWFPCGRDNNSMLVTSLTRLEKALGLHRLIIFSPWVAFIAKKEH